MTKFLLRLFVPGTIDPDDPKTRSAVGRLSGIVGIVCNVALFALKLAVGIFSASVSITADAINNLSDAVSSVVTLLGFRLARRPADSEHPYGHARYEYLSGLTVSALILVIGVELAQTSVKKILAPEPIHLTVPALAILFAAIAVKLWLYLFNRHLSRRISSGALAAAAADSRNDMIATGAVVLAAGIEALTEWRIDGVMGLAVALFVLYSGISLARETISPLLGQGASPELRRVIASEVERYDTVLGYHDLMVHDYGPGQRFASIHVEMDQKTDPLRCHDIIDAIERECLEKHRVHLVIHYDPVVTDDAELTRMRDQVSALLAAFDSRLKVHDFRMILGNGQKTLLFDVTLPRELAGRELQIKHELEDALAESGQGVCNAVITFDPEFLII